MSMKQDTKAWLVRIGSLLIILGFFFPSFVVSCNTLVTFKETLSLMDMVSRLRETYSLILFLYLIPLGGLLTLVVSFVPPNLQFSKPTSLLIQFAGVVAGVFGGLLALLNLAKDLNSTNAMNIKPDIGALVLFLGYSMAVVGLVMQWLDQQGQPVDNYYESNKVRETVILDRQDRQRPYQPPPDEWAQPRQAQQNQAQQYQAQSFERQQPVVERLGCHVRLVNADGSFKKIALNDRFQVGRSRDNEIVLNDIHVSRQHAVFRSWEGAWFIQDLGSQSGIFVNKQKVRAIRLKDNDTIQIGQSTLIFKAVDG